MRMPKVVLALVCAAAAFGQAKQPKPKSQKELDALVAAQNAAGCDPKAAAADAVIEKFADTDFKAMVLTLAADACQRTNPEKSIVYGERALEADPKNYQALLLLGQLYASRTKEFDLDKEDKLKKAEDYANRGLEAVKTAEKPNPQIPDEQWNEAKKQMASQGYEVLGTAAMVRKKYDAAIEQYKLAVAASTPPDPSTLVRLAAAYNQAGKPDEALPLLEKVMNTPDAHPQVKSVAQAERVRSMQIKQKGSAPAPKPEAGSSPSPQPVPTPTPE